ncbi:acetyl-CoA synthetase-like protein [Nadsonia fulvescens var. elongata DSM 6958]|uniref:Acetyl-CoA synthetase-like protein n=1 Tax=Nadsonia fulvescens var. elongata DSM 6958 TaxID=857566 RepID=A0A1E3PHP9_9ASCO|nr:acetyl-CoA synthetase-like protein [Nadsonia fulvescens var. elongata DSM 6958]
MDLSIPAGLPDSIRQQLLELKNDYDEGDITEKGYIKKRDRVLNNYLVSNGNSSTNSSVNATIISAPTATNMSANGSGSGSGSSTPSLPFSQQFQGVSNQINRSPVPSIYSNDLTMPALPMTDSYSLYANSIEDISSTNNYIPPYQFQPTLPATVNESADKQEVLQMPLEPREIPEISIDPQNSAVSVSKFDNLPSILRHRGKSTLVSSRTSALIVLDNKGKEVATIIWEKLYLKAEKVAQLIRDKSSVYRGDRVVLLYQENEVVEFAVAILGCFLAGVVAVPISPNLSFRDILFIFNNTQAHLALTTDNDLKALQRSILVHKYQWPKGVEWWKTNEFGSYHPPSKKADAPALQVPDLAYIEFAKSPVGDLRGVVISHKTIIHQMTCLRAILNSRDSHIKTPKSSLRAGPKNIFLSNLDPRQSIGLILGLFYTVYTGDTLVWTPQSSLAVPGLYAHVISRYHVSSILSDYPGLKQVTYNYQSYPHLTRNFSKKLQVDFSSLKWCLIDALTVDTEFQEILADRWLKPLGNKNSREVIAPLLTLSEHGGMVISMRDWLGGQERLGSEVSLGNDGNYDGDDDCSDPFKISTVVLNKESLSTNDIDIIDSSPSVEDSRLGISAGAFGYPLPDATLAVVNPETNILSPRLVVGEIWIDSPCLSGGFWGLGAETDTVFHARCLSSDGPLDMEFLRTGLLGFTYKGKVYILGLYEDRLRQRIDVPTAIGKPLQQATQLYRYHYTSHLVNTVMRSVPSAFDCSAFDIFVNGEHLPVAILESSLATPKQVGNNSNLPKQVDKNALNEMAKKCIDVLFEIHKVKIYCCLITAPGTLPRIVKNGRYEIGNMLSKKKFDLGNIPAVFVKFGIIGSVRNIPVGQDEEGGIWSPMVSRMRTESLSNNDKQYSGVDLRDVVIDDRTAAPLSDFESIAHVLQWRTKYQAEELAYNTIDSKGKEGKGLSWKKFDQKIAVVANYLKVKIRVKPGDHVILLYTHSEEFVCAVYACFLTGVIAIPVSPIDSNRLYEDVPAYISIVKDYRVKAILVNADIETSMKNKLIHNHLKQSAAIARIDLPHLYNTAKLKATNASCSDLRLTVRKDWIQPDQTVLVWLYWTADHRRIAIKITHKTILGMCKVQKETCQMVGTKPIVGCVRSVSGIGFLYSCLLGVYLGASTYLVSPVFYATNPLCLFLTLSRYKVKDTYSTPQMMDYAGSSMKPKGFSLANTKNLMITFEGRPRTDICKRNRILFAPTGLESTAINTVYSHVLNPMITSRSYMCLEPIDIWLDPIALRQGYVSLVNPENYSNALHLHDSGMVPVSTQVAIVNPETCALCKVGEYGEIWVWSEANASGFYDSANPKSLADEFDLERLSGNIIDGNPDIKYIRTGDLGFLHNVSKVIGNGESQMMEFQTLFVLGNIGDTFEAFGLNHFPIDIENSVQKCHKNITNGGCAIFQAGGFIIMVVEVENSTSLASLVPIIVNTVLDEHQLALNIVAFVAKGDLPRSRLNEKQRGKTLALWVTKKLKIIEKFGVAEDEKALLKFINQHASRRSFDHSDSLMGSSSFGSESHSRMRSINSISSS